MDKSTLDYNKGGGIMQQEMWGDFMANLGMEEMVKDHEKRISQLEQNYAEVRREMTNINTSQLRIESTLLTESRNQQQLITKLFEQKFDLDKTNLTNKWKFFLTICGSGGVVGVIVLAIYELIKGALK